MPKPDAKKTKSAPKHNTSHQNLRVAITALILAIGVLLILVSAGVFSGQDCTRIYRNDQQVTINGKVFETEVTRSAQEMQKGLGGRDCIGDNQAMPFVFNRPNQHAIWMKDMKFPIDVIWINQEKKIVAIEKNFKPETYPDAAVNERDKPSTYVLEVEAGTADELGLQLGTAVNF